MNPILDRFISPLAPFRVRTRTELFALRLAQKLGEAQSVRHFMSLIGPYSEAQLIQAFRLATNSREGRNAATSFHEQLPKCAGNGLEGKNTNLIAIRVERRTVAVAVFHGDQLEFAQARQLSSSHEKALVSAVGFVNWVLSRFSADSVALESIPNGHEYHRKALHEAIVETLRQRALPIWDIPKSDLFRGYGYPELRTRKELRDIATVIWPILSGTAAKVFTQDAAVLGLHVQIERLFLF